MISKCIQSKIEFYPTDKDKFKKAPRTMRALHKLDDLDPDKHGYLNALNSEVDSLRTMNVYTSSHNLDINYVSQHKIGSSKLIFSKKTTSRWSTFI